jgi:hypothetical protein
MSLVGRLPMGRKPTLATSERDFFNVFLEPK